MKTVLITGASSGIGKAFVEIFAKKKFNLVIVARSADKLEEISNKVEEQYGVRVTVFTFDLSQPDIAYGLYSKIKDRKISIDVVVNNAGIGGHGDLIDSDLSTINNMLCLNVITLTELTLLFVKEMKRKNGGKILNIASTASFQPVPKFSVYAASKSYVLNFTEALCYELKDTNISVSVLCPGPTATGFEKTASIVDSNLFKGSVMSAEIVAKVGYDGLMKNKMTIIPGFKNKLMAFFSNMTPSRKLLVWVSAKVS